MMQAKEISEKEPTKCWWFFSPPPNNATVWQTIVWWELRRPLYNILVLTTAAVSLFLIHVLVPLYIKIHPGEDIVEPILIFLGPILMNICYTAGSVVRILGVPGRYAPALLRLGFKFSLGVVLLPSVLHTIFAFISLFVPL